MKSLAELIVEAQQVLDEIAAHDSFVEILESELWEYPETSLSQCRECLEDLAEVQQKLKKEPKCSTPL